MPIDSSATSSLILDKIGEALSLLGRTSGAWSGLIPGMLDRRSGAPLFHMPEPLRGQRQSDRSFPGFNLMHEHVTLRLMYDLEDSEFAAIADACLHRFASHCCDTPSGLFPWGEHSFWNLIEDRPGNGYALDRTFNGLKHDHLLQAPVWLWEKLWTLFPSVVIRFAEGLDNHWHSGAPAGYNRHAALMSVERNSVRGKRSCDFPRHSGFYILDWSFVFARTGDAGFRHQIQDMLDYWWSRFVPGRCLPIESRSPAGDPFDGMLSPSQTLSLAVSLLESAELLQPADSILAALCRERASAYLDAYLGDFHQPRSASQPPSGGMPPDEANRWNTRRNAPVVFGSVYGAAPATAEGLLLLRAHSLLPSPACLDAAGSIGLSVRQARFPQDVQVPAKDAGLALSLLVDLHHHDPAGAWLDAASPLADFLMDAYLDAPLPRAAFGVDYYESQTIPGQLLHALARFAMAARHSTAPFPADYTIR